MTSSFLFYSIIIIITIDFFIERILSYINAQHFDDKIPEKLKNIYNEDEYKKSQAYKKTNYRFNNVTSTFTLIITLLFLFFGGFEWVDRIARNYSSNSTIITLLFFAIIFIGNDILTTPFSYYHTFIIEEKFGFNKTTLKTFLIDKVKGWLLSFILGGSILTLIIWFYTTIGVNFWIYTWGLITVFTIFMNLFYSKLIVPLFNKQIPLENGELKDRIQTYANQVDFNIKNVFIIDGSKRSTKANAYFSGFGKEKRIILYDTLIKDLTNKEIVAVLAHEVGHYKKKHTLINLFFSIILTGFTLYILSIFINQPELSKAIGVSIPSFHAALITFSILYSPISEITDLIMNSISRKFEYQADNYAKKTYSAEFLISSLKKLSKNSLSNLTPHKAYVFKHYSHPTLLQRINNLNFK